MQNNIVSVAGDKLYACARFTFRGFIVSASTILHNGYYETTVFNEETGDKVFECDTVEAAINWIICETEKE